MQLYLSLQSRGSFERGEAATIFYAAFIPFGRKYTRWYSFQCRRFLNKQLEAESGKSLRKREMHDSSLLLLPGHSSLIVLRLVAFQSFLSSRVKSLELLTLSFNFWHFLKIFSYTVPVRSGRISQKFKSRHFLLSQKSDGRRGYL